MEVVPRIALTGYRSLGRSGLRVSPVGLGMMSFCDPALQSWALDADRAAPIIREAAGNGITLFDTADLLAGKRGARRPTARSSEDRRLYRDCDLAIAEVVQAVADERGASAAQIALACLVARAY